MWLDILEWTKKGPFVNAHQRVTSVKGDFNYQMDRVVSPVDTSQHLFPTTPVIAQRLMDKVAMVAGMEVRHGFSKLDSHSRLTQPSHCKAQVPIRVQC